VFWGVTIRRGLDWLIGLPTYIHLSALLPTINWTTNLVAPVVFKITPWHRPHRKHRFRQYLYCCMRIRWCGNVFIDPLPKNGLHNTVVYSSNAPQRLYMLHLSGRFFRGLCLATGLSTTKIYRNLVEKPEGNGHGRPRNRWEDNNSIILQTRHENADWIY
jgi:hypothetical protein